MMVVGTKWFAEFVRTRAAERAVWIFALFILVNVILSNRSYNGLLGGSGTDDYITHTPDPLTPGASTSQRQSSFSKEDPALSDASNATSDTNQTLTLAPACEVTHMKLNVSDAGGLVDNCTAEIGRLQLVMDGLHREYGLESMRNGLVMAGGQKNRTTLFLRKLHEGKHMIIVVHGGSITDGSKLDPEKGDRTYVPHLEQRLNHLFPALNGGAHKVYVGAIGGGGSGVHHYCADNIIRNRYCSSHAPNHTSPFEEMRNVSRPKMGQGECEAVRDARRADLVLLELAPNDYVALEPKSHANTTEAEHVVLRSQEKLVRHYLSQPSTPLVAFVNFAFCDALESRVKLLSKSSELVLNRVAVHYGVPTLSFVNAFAAHIFPVNPSRGCAKRGKCSNNAWIADFVHPTDRGHRAMADLVSYLLLEKFITILREAIISNQVSSNSLPPSKVQNEIDLREGGSTRLAAVITEKPLDLLQTNLVVPEENVYTRGSDFSGIASRALLAHQTPSKSNISKQSGFDTSTKEHVDVQQKLVGCPSCQFCLSMEATIDPLPQSLVLEESSTPMCFLAAEWKVVKGGDKWKIFGSWVQAPSGKDRPRVTIEVDFGAHSSFGIVYKRSWQGKYKDMGVTIEVDNKVVATLSGMWEESSFASWFLNSSIIGHNSGTLGKKLITLRPHSGGVIILALVAD